MINDVQKCEEIKVREEAFTLLIHHLPHVLCNYMSLFNTANPLFTPLSNKSLPSTYSTKSS